jgi:hypothetical protein
MAKRPAPSLEHTGIPRARKGEAAPAVLDDLPEKPIPTSMFLGPGYKPQDKAVQPNVQPPQQEASATPEPDSGDVPVLGPGQMAPRAPMARPTTVLAQAVIEAEPAGRAPIRLVPRKAQARGEPRSPVTTRLTYTIQDRLFAAATQLGQTQQGIIEGAIDEYLARHGL